MLQRPAIAHAVGPCRECVRVVVLRVVDEPKFEVALEVRAQCLPHLRPVPVGLTRQSVDVQECLKDESLGGDVTVGIEPTALAVAIIPMRLLRWG